MPGLATATASVEINAAQDCVDAGHGDGPRSRHRSRPRQVDAHRPGAGVGRLRVQLLPADRARRAVRCRGCSPRRAPAPRDICGPGCASSWCASRTAYASTRRDRRPVPVLRIGGPAKPVDELPDLDRQLGVGARPADREDRVTTSPVSLASDPERSVSRLVCPRVLAPDTSYLACVVPTFELGRKAGLGLDVRPEDEAQPASRRGPRRRRRSSCRSTTRGRSRPVPAATSSRSRCCCARGRCPTASARSTIDVGESGLALDVPAGTTLPMRGALQPVGATPKSWPHAPRSGPRGSRRCTPVLNAPAEVTRRGRPAARAAVVRRCAGGSGHRRPGADHALVRAAQPLAGVPGDRPPRHAASCSNSRTR